MKFFIDTAEVDEIKNVANLGIIDGVTTNPSLIAKSGRKFEDVINEIVKLIDGPISGEIKATTTNYEDIIKEAEEISKINKNMVVKIPMTVDGIKAVNVLNKKNIKTNVTLIFSASQALVAAKAGATYVSPFLGRLDDISTYGINLIEEISVIFKNYNIKTEIICASIRNPLHVVDCAKIGADIATIPYKVIMQLIEHPLTNIGIEKFKNDYLKSNK